MEISRAATGLLAAVCIAAGAGGTYLAVKNASQSSSPQVSVTPEPVAPVTVEQSEGVVAEAEAPVPAERPAPIAVAPRPAAPPRKPAAAPAPRASAPPVATIPEPAPPREEAPVAVVPPSITDNQASRSVEPAGPTYDELVVAAQSVIGLQMESSVTSERARVEDEVVARVSRDVKVGDRVAIPAGARAHGEVTLVEKGGRVRDRARLGVRFTSIVLADGTRLPIQTEAVYREGDAPSRESAAKIGGGAIGGAIIGGLLGGAKGAAIGGTIGAGGGTAAVMAGGRNNATLSSGSPLTVRLEEPVSVTVER
jgi:hypothetical protein